MVTAFRETTTRGMCSLDRTIATRVYHCSRISEPVLTKPDCASRSTYCAAVWTSGVHDHGATVVAC